MDFKGWRIKTKRERMAKWMIFYWNVGFASCVIDLFLDMWYGLKLLTQASDDFKIV